MTPDKSKQGIEEIIKDLYIFANVTGKGFASDMKAHEAIAQATLAIKEYYLGLLPKEKDGVYCGEEECNQCDTFNHGYNTAIQEMREKIG